MKKLIILLFLVATLGWSCIDGPDYPLEPVIEMLGITNDTMVQDQFNTDSTVIVIGFTDGDGNIGSDDHVNVFVKDLRDNFISDQYRIPTLPNEGAKKGISGELFITLYTTCCTYPNGAPPCEPSSEFPTNTLVYEIYILDEAGNMSNAVQTPPIILKCD